MFSVALKCCHVVMDNCFQCCVSASGLLPALKVMFSALDWMLYVCNIVLDSGLYLGMRVSAVLTDNKWCSVHDFCPVLMLQQTLFITGC